MKQQKPLSSILSNSLRNISYYKEQNHIERAINDLKRFLAVTTHFDKRATNYFAACCLIAALTWLQL